jgi:hypothetical protein
MLNSERQAAAIKRFISRWSLRGLVASETWMSILKAFPVWRTVWVGSYKTPAAYVKVLDSAGNYYASQDAIRVFPDIACSQQRVRLDLFDVSGADLGLTGRYSHDVALRAVESLGYGGCSAEVGFSICIEYAGQPMDASRHLAANPFTRTYFHQALYVGLNEEGPWLHTVILHPNHFYVPEDRWVLCLPASPA